MKRKITASVCGLLIAGLCLTGCGKVDGTKTVVTVNGQEVSLGAASTLVRYQQAQQFSYYSYMYAMYGMQMDSFWDSPVGGDTEEVSGSVVEAEDTAGKTYGDQFKESMIEELTDMVLLQEHAGDYGIALTDEEQAKIGEVAKAFFDANDAAVLAKDGITVDGISEFLKLYTIRVKMEAAVKEGTDREVSDEEAAQSKVTYTRLSYAAEDTEDVVAADDQKAKKELMEGILAAMQKQENIAEMDMEDVAGKLSEDAFTNDVAFDSESTLLSDAVKDAVAGLKDGELYGAVIDDPENNSYYVVRMDAVFDQEATDEKKAEIIEQREKEYYDSVLEDWRNGVSVNVDEQLWGKIIVSDSQPYTVKEQQSAE